VTALDNAWWSRLWALPDGSRPSMMLPRSKTSFTSLNDYLTSRILETGTNTYRDQHSFKSVRHNNKNYTSYECIYLIFPHISPLGLRAICSSRIKQNVRHSAWVNCRNSRNVYNAERRMSLGDLQASSSQKGRKCGSQGIH
jgi:hypothetical protein